MLYYYTVEAPGIPVLQQYQVCVLVLYFNDCAGTFWYNIQISYKIYRVDILLTLLFLPFITGFDSLSRTHTLSPLKFGVFLVQMYGIVIARMGSEGSHRLGTEAVGNRQKLSRNRRVRPGPPRIQQRAGHQKLFIWSMGPFFLLIGIPACCVTR